MSKNPGFIQSHQTEEKSIGYFEVWNGSIRETDVREDVRQVTIISERPTTAYRIGEVYFPPTQETLQVFSRAISKQSAFMQVINYNREKVKAKATKRTSRLLSKKVTTTQGTQFYYTKTKLASQFQSQVGGMLKPIDKSLIEKIHSLVGEDNPPPITNRRYHPKDVDIRNTIYKATVKLMLSKIDQENLKKIKGWNEENPEELLFFRPCSLSPTEAVFGNTSDTDSNIEANITEKLLFAYQTAWQRHLMGRYGNEIMLLDATYKTMRFDLPLFFLVVTTKVNYTVVGSFTTQDDNPYRP
ncbi:predicted protein [Nematostella vectensis]|uniref:MULE transposase domain-containing protein n=1 Tax=Nematostella vectensis TaxID=45351 RepID=A7SWQ2_NEMVE|nr:predicted protein [Nematostella vectensis]|eukprot:XP_001623957.1 predicted protein [Nematostella vectensis]